MTRRWAIAVGYVLLVVAGASTTTNVALAIDATRAGRPALALFHLAAVVAGLAACAVAVTTPPRYRRG